MVLEEFRKIDLTWDKATRRIYDVVRVASSDENGRKLVVQVLNDGQVENLSGTSLHLYWETANEENKGLDAFEVVDAAQGIFQIYFTSGMVSNIGNLAAHLHLVDDQGTVTSEPFKISVFEGVDNDAVESSDSFTALTEALVTVSKYDSRIAKNTAQLAQKADDHIVRKKTQLITVNDVDEFFLNALSESGGTPITVESIPKDKSVSIKKTTFVRPGKNIWDGEYHSLVLIGDAVNGGYVEHKEDGVSIIQPLEEGETYTFSRKEGSSDRFRLATFNSFPKDRSQAVRYVGSRDAFNEFTLTAKSGEAYALLYLSTQNTAPDELMVEKGAKATEYEPHNQVLIDFAPGQYIPLQEGQVEREHISEGAVDASTTTFAKPSRNLFSGEFIYDKSFMETSLGYVMVDSSSQGVIVIEKLMPGETYTISRENWSSNRFTVLVFQDKPRVNSTSDRVINRNNELNEVTFTMGENEHYVAIYLSINENYKEPNEFQIEKGSERTPYVSPRAVEIDLVDTSNSDATKDSFKKIYVTKTFREYATNAGYESPYANDINAVYNKLDDIVADYPDYVTKTHLGNEITGLPIYQYEFNPPAMNFSSGATDEYPKVLYVTGTHGMEKHAVWGGVKAFEEMTTKWRESEELRLLRWNVHLIYIPILNPWGFNNNERKNSNGVDLNRNFTNGWAASSDPTARDYSGPSAASEEETKIMEQVFENHKDALFMVDHHNSGGWESQGHVIWSGSLGENIRTMLSGYNHGMASKAMVDYGYLPTDQSLQNLSSVINGGLAYHAQKTGIDAALLETAVQFDTEQDTQKFNIESVVNLLGNVVNYYSH